MGIVVDFSESTLVLTLSEEQSRKALAQTAQKITDFIYQKKPQKIAITGSRTVKWDGVTVAVLYSIIKQARAQHIALSYHNVPQDLEHLMTLALREHPLPVNAQRTPMSFLTAIGDNCWRAFLGVKRGCVFIRQVWFSLLRLCHGQAVMRKVDFLFALENCGYKAVGIVTLISFMIGLILAFVSAIQLEKFGAEIYIASLVTIGMTRIVGALMVGVVMAGRTGASYAATLGTMQVNNELDALKTMGLPATDFLILPRLLALVIAMPLLTILADFVGMLGGATVGVFMLDLSPNEYWTFSNNAFFLKNFLVGLFHSVVYGVVIALCGCYFGVHSGRDANSVGVAATQSVVSAIVWMIILTGLLTMLFKGLGI